MTQQLFDKTTTTQAPSPEVTRQPTYDQVIDRIIAECSENGVACDADLAMDTIYVLGLAVDHCRATGWHYIFTQDELDRCHDVMDIVVPDSIEGVVDVLPDSAYAGLNSLLLKGDELTIEHTKTNVDEVVYCTANIQIRVV